MILNFLARFWLGVLVLGVLVLGVVVGFIQTMICLYETDPEYCIGGVVGGTAAVLFYTFTHWSISRLCK